MSKIKVASFFLGDVAFGNFSLEADFTVQVIHQLYGI